ncbi:pyridoxine/pyridoxamine 5'-phosphate oxidase [Herbiconiux liukaitaii]|uniref:pyridoxine/pyridoxamine 5'-phosphate oxidase n=1 Tax=Herbiconiux liukaitaii TaxID=3342799 RepID=UPI0035BAECA0
MTLRDELRPLPSITGTAPPFEVHAAPADPTELFITWLREAIGSGVVEPHAATLSTVDAAGAPDARVLVLKDVTADGGFEIASGDESSKSRQLDGNAACALSFHWVPLARAVRIRGTAHRASAEDSARDFAARHPRAKAIALTGRQSSVMAPDDDPERSISEALHEVERTPGLVSPQWSVWRIVPTSIEFWQGSPDRNHTRLRYERTSGAWSAARLWA